uniref:MIF4G domain-containing protein n=1 Tax=Plectus sambesii TaxID=2011161 RepID=A0A914VM06_9BILA
MGKKPKTQQTFSCQLGELLNKMTPKSNVADVQKDFLNLDIYSKKERIGMVTEIIFERAITDCAMPPVYSDLCKRLISQELKETGRMVSEFQSSLTRICQMSLETKLEVINQPTYREVALNIHDENKIMAFKEEEEKVSKIFSSIRFIGELYQNQLIDTNFLLQRISQWFNQYKESESEAQGRSENSLLCAIEMLKSVGKTLDLDSKNDEIILDQLTSYYEELEDIAQQDIIFSDVRVVIENLFQLRNNDWKPIPIKRDRHVRQRTGIRSNHSVRQQHTTVSPPMNSLPSKCFHVCDIYKDGYTKSHQQKKMQQRRQIQQNAKIKLILKWNLEELKGSLDSPDHTLHWNEELATRTNKTWFRTSINSSKFCNMLLKQLEQLKTPYFVRSSENSSDRLEVYYNNMSIIGHYYDDEKHKVGTNCFLVVLQKTYETTGTYQAINAYPVTHSVIQSRKQQDIMVPTKAGINH